MSKEILWNIINSLLAGAISFFSAFAATGTISGKELGIAAITAGLVACVQFKNYWAKEESEYAKLFSFIKA